MELIPELMKLLRTKSMTRYLPPNGTAGLARSRVSGKRRVPLPPASTMPSTRMCNGLGSVLRGALGEVFLFGIQGSRNHRPAGFYQSNTCGTILFIPDVPQNSPALRPAIFLIGAGL